MPAPWERPDVPSQEDNAPSKSTPTPPWARKEDAYPSVETMYPTREPTTRQDLRGDVAAGMRGALEAVPFGTDMGALLKTYVGNPLTGEKPSGDFTKTKREMEARNALFAKEHPTSYYGGALAGGAASLLAPELAGLGIAGRAAQLERGIAQNVVPSILSTTPVESKLLAKGAMASLGGGAQGAIQGLGTGTSLEERLGNAQTNALIGSIGGPLGAAAIPTAGAVVNKLTPSLISKPLSQVAERVGLYQTPVKAPTTQQIKDIAQGGYDVANRAGLTINTPGLAKIHSDITRRMTNSGLNTRFNPGHQDVVDLVNELHPSRSASLDLDSLHNLREQIDTLARDYREPSRARMASIARKSLNDSLDALNPRHASVNPGFDVARTVDVFKDADRQWNRYSKLDTLDKAYKLARSRASSSRGSRSVDEKYRGILATVLNKINNGYDNRWTAAERKALEDAVYGGQIEGLTELTSKLSPLSRTSVGLGTVAGGIGSIFAPAAAPYALGALGLGVGSEKLKDYLLHKGAQEFRNVVAGGERNVASGLYDTPLRQQLVQQGTRVAPLPQAYLLNRPRGVVAEDNSQENNPEYYEQFENPRSTRAAGGRLGNRDYPAKRLTRVERAAKRAMDAIAMETKPLMDQPDQVIANALKLAAHK